MISFYYFPSSFYSSFVVHVILVNSERGSCVLSAEHLQSGSTTRNYNQSTNQHLAIIISIHDEALSIQLFSFYYLHQMFFFVPVLVTIHEVLRRLWLVYKDVVT